MRFDDMLRRHGYVTEDSPKWKKRQPLIGESEVPCLIERPHLYPGPFGLYLFGAIPLSKPALGGMVMYLDGHVEFIPYPGKWPMTEKTITTLTELAALG